MEETIPDTVPEDEVVNTREMLGRAGLEPGMTIADCGCGREAIFTVAAAEIVGAAGVVYALDVVKDILAFVDSKLEGEGLNNVITIWTDLEIYGATKRILDGTVDLAILSDTIFQSQHKEDMLLEVGRMLKPGGKLLIVEWKASATPLGPPVEQRMTPDMLKSLASNANFHIIDEFEAGEYHNGMLWQK